MPAVNQIEVHPYFTTRRCGRTAGARHRHRGMVADRPGWSARGPTIAAIAERVGKTTAQVTLRWHIQRGDIIFPKSTTPSRIKENFDIFDFELTEDDRGDQRAGQGRRGPDRAQPGPLRLRASALRRIRTEAASVARPGRWPATSTSSAGSAGLVETTVDDLEPGIRNQRSFGNSPIGCDDLGVRHPYGPHETRPAGGQAHACCR